MIGGAIAFSWGSDSTKSASFFCGFDKNSTKTKKKPVQIAFGRARCAQDKERRCVFGNVPQMAVEGRFSRL